MESLLLFLLSLGCLILLLKWRTNKAQNELEGKAAPESIRTEPQHPDGVLYYFYHPSCGPCKQMGSIVDQLKQKYPDRVEKLNVADCQELTQTIGIKVTPTTIFIKNNIITKAIIGSNSGKTLITLLESNNP